MFRFHWKQQPALETLAYIGFFDEIYTTCFYVRASVEWGTWILLVGAFMLNLITQFIVRACDGAMEDREARVKGGLRFDAKHHESNVFRSTITGCLSCICCLSFIEYEDKSSRQASGRRGAAEEGSFKMQRNTKRDNLVEMANIAHDRRSFGRKKGTSVFERLGGLSLGRKRVESRVSPWKAVSTDNGEVYYWNQVTGQTQWEKPASLGGGGSRESAGSGGSRTTGHSRVLSGIGEDMEEEEDGE